MIRVVCPFTAIKPGVAEALDATGIAWEAIDVSGSDSSYWELLDSLWTAGETFIVVEHDVIVRPDTLDYLRYCPQSDVCTYPIPYFWSPQAVGMACNKFGSTFIARHPDLMAQAAEMSDEQHPPKHWCRQDQWIQTLIRPEVYHVHLPPLAHYREPGKSLTSSHGCS